MQKKIKQKQGKNITHILNIKIFAPIGPLGPDFPDLPTLPLPGGPGGPTRPAVSSDKRSIIFSCLKSKSVRKCFYFSLLVYAVEGLVLNFLAQRWQTTIFEVNTNLSLMYFHLIYWLLLITIASYLWEQTHKFPADHLHCRLSPGKSKFNLIF